MKVELIISDNGYVKCLINKNNNVRYYKFNDISSFILKEKNFIKNVKIENGNIFIHTNETKIFIKNYLYNIDSNLAKLIDESIKIKIQKRKEYFKKERIQRTKAIAGTVIICVGIFASTVFANSKKKKVESALENPNVGYEDINEDYVIDHELNNIDISETEILESNMNSKEIKETETLETNINNNKEVEKQIVQDEQSNNINDLVFLAENLIDYDIKFDSRVESDKFIETKEKYFEKIKSISLEYGIDPQIMLAIATQESGVHRIVENRPAIGLMQIEVAVWNNENITAYNYSKKSNETIKITKENLKDLDFNIRVACMIFQNCLKNSNNNLLVAIQMYNFGYGNIRKVFKQYYGNNNINLKDAIDNCSEDWINYRSYVNEGDSDYLEHVLSYVEDLHNINCNINNNENEIATFKINNSKKLKF